MSLDQSKNQLFGDLPDSLMNATVGDSFLVLIRDFDNLPNMENCPDCPLEKKCEPCPVCPDLKANPPLPEPRVVIKRETIYVDRPVWTPLVRTQPAKTKPEISPSSPSKVSFEITWEYVEDNVDLYVCRGNACVSGTKKRTMNNNSIGVWDSGISRTGGVKTIIKGTDYRTNMEAVRQVREIIPGTFTLYAHFKETTKQNTSVDINGLIYTKAKNGKVKGERFTKRLKLNPKDGEELGTVQLKADGTFTFKRK